MFLGKIKKIFGHLFFMTRLPRNLGDFAENFEY